MKKQVEEQKFMYRMPVISDVSLITVMTIKEKFLDQMPYVSDPNDKRLIDAGAVGRVSYAAVFMAAGGELFKVRIFDIASMYVNQLNRETCTTADIVEAERQSHEDFNNLPQLFTT